MNETRGAALAALREGIDVDTGAVSYQVLYEDWLGRDDWHLARQGLPLLVGIDPARWASHLASRGLGATADTLLAVLAADLTVDPEAMIAPARLGGWARQHGLDLPPPFARMLDFIQRVLPSNAALPPSSGGDAALAQAADRERVLGAALMLATRFPGQCRNEHGFFDGALIADLVLEKAALWFPLEPPALTREAMTALIEQYLG